MGKAVSLSYTVFPMKSRKMGARSSPKLSRQTLAIKLRQNWLAQYPMDNSMFNVPLDDSLTSLNWLQNLNVMKMTEHPQIDSIHPSQYNQSSNARKYSAHAQVDPNVILKISNPLRNKEEEPIVLHNSNSSTVDSGGELYSKYALGNMNYETDSRIKPPYSYATLICMAIRKSSKQKITLSGIYNWIIDNFMYYRQADPSWQNSIRHNLSLNKCFEKVPRRKDEPGKGGFWRINPEFQNMFVDGIFKKRRYNPTPNNTQDYDFSEQHAKKIKIEPCDKESNTSIPSSINSSNPTSISSMLAPIKNIGELNENRIHHRALNCKKSASKPVPVADLSDAIDFSWNAILNQDIDVGGVKVKTEEIIDEQASTASPITALSPPLSNNSCSLSMEDLFSTDLNSSYDGPLDLSDGSTLDLTISGIGLKKPDWWNDSAELGRDQSRLSTPIHELTEEDLAHPWAEDKYDQDDEIACLDNNLTNLYDLLL